MFKQGTRVSIEGGPFSGCRGIVAVTQEEGSSAVLVTVERHHDACGVNDVDYHQYGAYPQHWIAPEHLEGLS